MKLKIKYLLVWITFSAVLFHSCEKDLDVVSKSSFTDDVIFSDPSLAEGAIMGIYNIIGETRSYITRLWPFMGMGTDIEYRPGATSTTVLTSSSGLDLIPWYDTDSNLPDGFNNASDDPWSVVYMGIERANLCISGLEKYGDKNDPAIRHLLGEALTLRAFYYNDLIKWWGDVPARFEPINLETLYLPKTNRDTIYNRIIEDLKTAIPLMNSAGLQYTGTTKRLSKEAARALRARIALAAAGYSMRPVGTNDSQIIISVSEQRRRELYEIAREECRAIIESGIYSLDKSFKNIFYEECQDIESQGREAIFQLPFNFGVRGHLLYVLGLRREADGNSATTAKHNSVSIECYFRIIPSFFYDFDKNDTRRDVSVAPYAVKKSLVDGVMEQTLEGVTLFNFAKYRAEWYKGKLTGSSDGISPIVFRYADVLLMFAEADLFLGGNEGAEYFNQVRRRAFGVDIFSGSAHDLPLTLENIQQERAFEFVGENVRKYDLIRWGLLKTKIDEAKQNMRDLRNGSGKYADVANSVIYYKHEIIDKTDGERGLIVYGLNRGEHEDKQATDPSGGWKQKTWVNANDLSDIYIDNIVHGDPDKRQILPIMNIVIVNSQGALSNDYGYNN